MRILHYLPSLSLALGGPSRAVIDLCGALAATGHKVTLATAEAGDSPELWSGNPHFAPAVVTVPRPRTPGHWYSASALAGLERLVREHEVLHVHGMWEFANVQLSRLARSLDKPYVISVHGMLDQWSMSQSTLKKRLFLKLVGMNWLRNASAVHFTAKSELLEGGQYLHNNAGRVVPLLIDLEPYRMLPDPITTEESLGGRCDGPRVLFLSRLHPVKSLETLLNAMRLLVKRGRRLSLLIAGDGEPSYVARLKMLAKQTGADIRFLGMVTGRAKLALYQACNVLAVPSQHENFGMVFIEALACGVPVVTTRAVAIGKDLESSGAVTLVERTSEQFADAIEKLLLDLPATTDRGRRGRHWVFDVFDPTAGLKRFETLYADAICRHRAHGNPGIAASAARCSELSE